MDIHNYPIDLAVKVHDERARALLRERSLQRERRALQLKLVGRRHVGWSWQVLLAEPLFVGGAGFLLGWLVFPRG